jgi:hypothetical protein
MACENGHLDDFPWVEFLHGAVPCAGRCACASRVGRTGPGDVLLSCDGCRRRRRLSQAFGEDSARSCRRACRGRHPHLGALDRDCHCTPETLILGASNSWFPVQSSALSIPSQEGSWQAIDKACRSGEATAES